MSEAKQPTKRVGDLFLEHNLLNQRQLDEALARQREEGKPLGLVLFEMGAINEDRKLAVYRNHFDMEVVSLEDFDIEPNVLKLLPKGFCERHLVAPILRERGELVLAIENPMDVVAIDEARNLTGKPIHPVIASVDDILSALQQYPDHEEESEPVDLSVRRRRDRWRKIGFAIMLLLPLPLFFILLAYSSDLQAVFIDNLSHFEKILVPLLVWALWAAIVYEVDGLLFRARE